MENKIIIFLMVVFLLVIAGVFIFLNMNRPNLYNEPIERYVYAEDRASYEIPMDEREGRASPLAPDVERWREREEQLDIDTEHVLKNDEEDGRDVIPDGKLGINDSRENNDGYIFIPEKDEYIFIGFTPETEAERLLVIDYINEDVHCLELDSDGNYTYRGERIDFPASEEIYRPEQEYILMKGLC